MGLYDEIRWDAPLPEGHPPDDRIFQTKSLDPCLDHFRVTPEGRLELVGNGWNDDDLERAHGATWGIERGERSMIDVVESLILDLLEWVAARERTYEEVMDAWRTSCPKLTVWEDANDRGLVATEVLDGRSIVKPTARGLDLIATRSISGR